MCIRQNAAPLAARNSAGSRTPPETSLTISAPASSAGAATAALVVSMLMGSPVCRRLDGGRPAHQLARGFPQGLALERVGEIAGSQPDPRDAPQGESSARTSQDGEP